MERINNLREWDKKLFNNARAKQTIKAVIIENKLKILLSKRVLFNSHGPTDTSQTKRLQWIQILMKRINPVVIKVSINVEF